MTIFINKSKNIVHRKIRHLKAETSRENNTFFSHIIPIRLTKRTVKDLKSSHWSRSQLRRRKVETYAPWSHSMKSMKRWRPRSQSSKTSHFHRKNWTSTKMILSSEIIDTLIHNLKRITISTPRNGMYLHERRQKTCLWRVKLLNFSRPSSSLSLSFKN